MLQIPQGLEARIPPHHPRRLDGAKTEQRRSKEETRNFVDSPMQNAIFGIKSSFSGVVGSIFGI